MFDLVQGSNQQKRHLFFWKVFYKKGASRSFFVSCVAYQVLAAIREAHFLEAESHAQMDVTAALLDRSGSNLS